MAELVYAEKSFRIMGACFEVYRCMGKGFLESVYQECLKIEFLQREIPFVPEFQLPIAYKGRTLEQYYKADFVCFDKIIVEVKSINHLSEQHHVQVFNYYSGK